MSWKLTSVPEWGFDPDTGSEYPVDIPVATPMHPGRVNSLELHEVVQYLNILERQCCAVINAGNDSRQAEIDRLATLLSIDIDDMLREMKRKNLQ